MKMGPIETLENVLKVAVMPADLRRAANEAIADLKGAKIPGELYEKFAKAALEHSANTGEFEMAVGDLEILLGACLRQMTDAQKAAMMADEEVVQLLTIPEFDAIFGGEDPKEGV